MKSFRSILGWGAVAIFSSVNLLQAISLTCPGATNLVFKNGKCELVELKYVCVPNAGAVDVQSCVPGNATMGQIGFCSSAGESCLAPVMVQYNPANQCSTEGASGMVLAQSVPCP